MATSWRSTSSSATIADSPRVTCGSQPNIRIAVRYSSRTTMQSIVRDGGRTPAHTMCEQFWHGTGVSAVGWLTRSACAYRADNQLNNTDPPNHITADVSGDPLPNRAPPAEPHHPGPPARGQHAHREGPHVDGGRGGRVQAARPRLFALAANGEERDDRADDGQHAHDVAGVRHRLGLP